MNDYKIWKMMISDMEKIKYVFGLLFHIKWREISSVQTLFEEIPEENIRL